MAKAIKGTPTEPVRGMEVWVRRRGWFTLRAQFSKTFRHLGWWAVSHKLGSVHPIKVEDVTKYRQVQDAE